MRLDAVVWMPLKSRLPAAATWGGLPRGGRFFAACQFPARNAVAPLPGLGRA